MNISLKKQQLSVSKNVALGVAQIFLWGGSFFILSVLAEPIMKETNWSHSMVYGSLSLSLLISGLLSPKIGKLINSNNKDFVLLYSGMIMSLGLLILGFANQFWVFVIGWAVLGIAMGMGLYDALFALLGKQFGKEANKSIVQITLVSGFAPTISWFFISCLLSNFGWRYTCFIYAAALFIVIFPIHKYILRPNNIKECQFTKTNTPKTNLNDVFHSKIFYLLLINFIIGSVLMSGLIIHLVDILLTKKIEMETAIIIAALLGPSQVGVRVLDIILPKKTPVKTAIISSIAILFGLLLLLFSSKTASFGVIIFGMGNGMRSILRGTLPLAIFGHQNYAEILGKLARLPLIAQAITPFVGGIVIQLFNVSVFLYALCILAFINIFLILSIEKKVKINNMIKL